MYFSENQKLKVYGTKVRPLIKIFFMSSIYGWNQLLFLKTTTQTWFIYFLKSSLNVKVSWRKQKRIKSLELFNLTLSRQPPYHLQYWYTEDLPTLCTDALYWPETHLLVEALPGICNIYSECVELAHVTFDLWGSSVVCE